MSKRRTSREVLRVIRRCGFVFDRQRGSHAIYYHTDGRRITVSIHKGKQISPGVFLKILSDLGLDKEDFWEV